MRELQEFDKTPLNQVREFVIDQLKSNYAHDNLTEGDFETRLEKANAAFSKQVLLELVEDLPRLEEGSGTDVAPTRGGVLINRGPVRETDNMVAVLGGTTRKGLWKPARSTRILTVLGGTDLDYTEAEMPAGVTQVEVFCLLGGTDIKVPPGVRVEVDVVGILGGVDNKADTPVDPAAPTLRIRGFTLLGGVDIKTKRARKRNSRR
jgi:hypothetical protein